MKKTLFFLFLLCNFSFFAQNLVKNPSFETLNVVNLPCTYTTAGNDFNKIVAYWKSSQQVSPDILTVEKNCFSFLPHTGQSMLGIIAYHPHEDSGYSFDYHEQVQGELMRPLEVGQTYTFEFWVYADDSLSARHLKKVLHAKSTEVIPLFCNNLGVEFRTEPLDEKMAWQEQLSQENARYVSPKVVGHTNERWKKIQFLVKADKPYRYFYLGNFNADKETTTSLSAQRVHLLDSINTMQPILAKRTKTFWERKKRIAYYCIDDVSLQIGNHIENEEEIPVFAPKSVYTFKNVVFETGKATLLTNSLGEVEALANYLLQHPEQSILIVGHTDNMGTETQNQTLSEQRANAVRQVLVAKGCNPKYIRTQGNGSKTPVALNTTLTGRQQNRRVEVQF
jgi:outer membrane protein OmpA-like peptidoglycan-associated protein